MVYKKSAKRFGFELGIVLLDCGMPLFRQGLLNLYVCVCLEAYQLSWLPSKTATVDQANSNPVMGKGVTVGTTVSFGLPTV